MFAVASEGEIGRRIRLARESYRGAGMRQGDLADRIGVSHARLSNWERGLHDPHPISLVNQIASILEVPAEYLVTGARIPSTTPRTVAQPSGKIKVYGHVSAGDGNTSSIANSELEVPAELCRDDYGGLIIEGDSMMPLLLPSDVAVFRDWHAEKIGFIVAAKLLDSNTWVAKLLTHEAGEFVLRSLNSAYPPIVEPFQVCGYLVGFVRDDGPERLIRSNPYGIKPVRP